MGSDPVFILVNLRGGASHNIAPMTTGAYMDRFPASAPQNPLLLHSSQGLHPALTGLKTVYDEGRLAVYNLVGYSGSPNRSHEESTDIWFRGNVQKPGELGEGWAARMTSTMSNILSGVSLGGSNLLTQGGSNPPRALNDLNSLGYPRFKWSDSKTQQIRDTFDELMALGEDPRNSSLELVKSANINIDRTIDLVAEQTARELPGGADFPNSGFGRSCRDAAKLVNAPVLGVRFIYLERGGFDTHSNEAPSMTSNLEDINSGLSALITELKAMGAWNRVIISTMSEFSRTFENGSNGTDHGHAGPQFLMGGKILGGVKNPGPSEALLRQDGSFLRDVAINFHDLYAGVINAMGFDPEVVFPGSSPLNYQGFLRV
jgi:uncharacterized protein (DUF1501 family)